MKFYIRKDIDWADFDEDGNVALEYLPERRDCPTPDRQLMEEVFG